MLIDRVGKLPVLERFLYWIRERHAIYLRRETGKPKPWTDDKVLQQYFFTNPYREHDKTTVWFRKHVREPLRNDPRVLMATVIFRWFNYIPTGEVLLHHRLLTDWRLAVAKNRLRRLGKVFTGAFNISNSGSTKPKIDRVCDDYIQPIWQDRKRLLQRIQQCGTMQATHTALRCYMGMGGSGFMTYEVVCDLRHTYLLRSAVDKCTWSNPGPGAKRGLNRLLSRHLKEPVRDWLDQSGRLLSTMQDRLDEMPVFEMREVEHSLCEFDKYERARLGDGHVKRRYTGC